MSLYTSSSTDTRNDIIYMSTSKHSYPYKVYSNMRQQFWTHQFNMKIKKSKSKRLTPKIVSETDSRMYNSALETTNGMENISNFSITLNENNIQVEKLQAVAHLNTSENNEESFPDINFHKPPNEIPLSVDMSTQFNSDLKIIVEQDSKDKNVINIKFGGPFTGFMTGSGTIPHSNFLSLMSDSILDSVTKSKAKPHVEMKPIEEAPKVIKPKTTSSRRKSQESVRSEESLNYFATTRPMEPLITDTNAYKEATVPLNIRVPSESNILKSEIGTLNPIMTTEKSITTMGKYTEPYTDKEGNFQLPSITTSKSSDNIPAVLPRCIIKRIIRAMLTDLELPRNKAHNQSSLELKVSKLTNNREILNCNWHAAIIKARVMIGELIELILSVNVDNVASSLETLEPILMELKVEFINCCLYLLKVAENSKIKNQICLELLIDLIQEELKKLPSLFNEWSKSGRQVPFSTFFINNLTKDLSPSFSESFSKSEPKTISKANEIRVSQSSLDNKSTKSNQSLTGQNRRNKDNKSQSEKTLSEKPVALIRPEVCLDPSIITNSRVKKTMITIFQSAMKQNLQSQTLSRESRNRMIPLEFVDYRPVVTKNREMSLISELIQQTQLWSIPIKAGETSIEDLIEFIINTVSQDREVTKELYTEIEGELETLEHELIVSVAKNLHGSRTANDDLTTLSYEILVEIIFRSFAMAKYMFHSLETSGVDNLMLGKLFRNYISENSKQPGMDKKEVSSGHVKSDKYAHLTSEIMNYQDPAESSTVKPMRERSQSSMDKYALEHPDLLLNKGSEGYLLTMGTSSIRLDVDSPGIIPQESHLYKLASEEYGLSRNATTSKLYGSDSNVPLSPDIKPKPMISQDRYSVSNDEPGSISKSRKTSMVQTKPNSSKKNKLITKKAKVREPSIHTEHESSVLKDSTEKTSIRKTDSSTQMVTSGYQNQDQTKKVKINNSNDKVNSENTSWTDENKQLIVIFNKLMGQTLEINKIKETLHDLSNSVNERLTSWTCKMPSPEVDVVKSEVPKFAKTTNLYNIQEIIEPPKELFVSVQPTEQAFISEANLRAVRDERKSFIAPISNQMSEQRIRTPKQQSSHMDMNVMDLDVMKLIVEGSHNFLISKQIKNHELPQLERQDSCEPINTEFDKIFQWVVEKYEETLEGMKTNNACKKIVEALKTCSVEERQSIEKELIQRIVDQNNLIINNWVREICFHKVLKCLL